MKFAVLLAFFAAFVLSVNASAIGTNAARMARGLPPMKPHKRFNPTATQAKRTTASGTPSSQCNTGPIQCCDSVQSSSSSLAGTIIELLGIIVGGDVLVGITCSPVDVLGLGSNSCSAQPVCCEDNSHGTLISIGCIPITLDL